MKLFLEGLSGAIGLSHVFVKNYLEFFVVKKDHSGTGMVPVNFVRIAVFTGNYFKKKLHLLVKVTGLKKRKEIKSACSKQLNPQGLAWW